MQKNCTKKAVQKKNCAKIIANLVAPTGAEPLPKPSIQPCKKKLYKKNSAKKLCNNDCESGRTRNWCRKFPQTINVAMQKKSAKKAMQKKLCKNNCESGRTPNWCGKPP